MKRSGVDQLKGLGGGRRQCLVVTNGSYFLEVYSRIECWVGKMLSTPLLMKVMACIFRTKDRLVNIKCNGFI